MPTGTHANFEGFWPVKCSDWPGF